MEQREYNSRNYYTLNDGYCQEKVNFPFSWEYKPGVSKVIHHHHHHHHHQVSNNDTRRSNLMLQPPPRSSSRSGGNKQLPAVDTNGSASLRIRSFRLETQKGDPFVEAYKKCTQSPKHPFGPKRPNKSNKNTPSWLNIIKHIHILSCKFSGDVITMA